MGLQNHLTALPLELHTYIFSNLQPYDILQVRQTCQTLYVASLERTVWMNALHRICVENTLFEPSFPIASMSVLELQRASMGPHRWIARSSSKKRNFDGVLSHSATRHRMLAMLDLSIADLQSLIVHYLVPGGRYLFSLSHEWLVLWDLGSPYSSGREPHGIAAVPVKFSGQYLVHSTPDGKGLRVFLLYTTLDYPFDMASLYIYEIYPESTSPQLTQIAHTRIPGSSSESFYSLSYDRLIFAHGNVLTVWDYKANTWARWGVEGGYNKILTTKSAVTLVRTYGVSVWEIPPLLPESSLSMSTDPSVISPLFELHYPENHLYHDHHTVPCGWYSGTLQPIYYDVEEDPFAYPRMVRRFEIPPIISKVSGGTLNLLNTFEVPPNNHFARNARICQEKNVGICTDWHTDCLEIHITDIYDQQLPSFVAPLCYQPIGAPETTFCPVTGRVVHCEIDQESSRIIVLDF